jgi:hypothetical protein
MLSKANNFRVTELQQDIMGKFKETFQIADEARKFNKIAEKQLAEIATLQVLHQEKMERMLDR